MKRFLLISLLIFANHCYAEDESPPNDLSPVPEPPQLPKKVQDNEAMEPDITIIRKEKKVIHEYRRGGKLYMVKVIPDVGPPYYFIDTNGDGKMDVRRRDLESNLNVQQWQILEWE